MKIRDLDFLTAKKVVRQILIDFPETRDNNRLLLHHVLLQEYQEIGGDFLENLKDKKFTHTETICRASRDLQQKNPDLRGKEWNKRHGLEGYVIAQLQMEFNFEETCL